VVLGKQELPCVGRLAFCRHLMFLYSYVHIISMLCNNPQVSRCSGLLTAKQQTRIMKKYQNVTRRLRVKNMSTVIT